MTSNPVLLFCALAVFTSCSGQVNTNLPKDITTPSKPSPVVIRTPKPPGFRFPGTQDTDDTTLVSQYIRSIYQDSKGNFWFGTVFEGVCRYHKDTLSYYTELDVFNGSSVHSIAEDKHGNIWFATNKSVVKYDDGKFINYGEQEGFRDIPLNNKGCITNHVFVDKSDNLWVSTPGGIYSYNGKGFVLSSLLPAISIGCMLQDNAGSIWFASTDNGVYRFDGNSIKHITEQDGLISNHVSGMLQDKNGIFWFATNKGISRYDGKIFTQLTTNEGIPNNEIWGIYEEKSGIVWITARGSTTRYNPDAAKNEENPFTIFTPADGLNCCVQSMYQDRAGNMWWGSGSGLFRFDGRGFYQVKQKGPWQ